MDFSFFCNALLDNGFVCTSNSDTPSITVNTRWEARKDGITVGLGSDSIVVKIEGVGQITVNHKKGKIAETGVIVLEFTMDLMEVLSSFGTANTTIDERTRIYNKILDLQCKGVSFPRPEKLYRALRLSAINYNYKCGLVRGGASITKKDVNVMVIFGEPFIGPNYKVSANGLQFDVGPWPASHWATASALIYYFNRSEDCDYQTLDEWMRSFSDITFIPSSRPKEIEPKADVVVPLQPHAYDAQMARTRAAEVSCALIVKAIKDKVELGEFSITLGKLHPEVEKQLLELGFTVDHETRTVISW